MRLFSRKNCIRLIAAVITAAVLLPLTASCAEMMPWSNDSHSPPATIDGGEIDGTINAPDHSREFDPTLPPMTGPPAVPLVLEPVASGTDVDSNESVIIDHSNTQDGYVMIRWIDEPAEVGLRVQVIGPSGITYTYTLKDNGEWEVYPLSDGNGTYIARVLDMLGDGSGRGAVVLSAEFEVELIDEFATFLHPNQYVNFNEDCRSVHLAAGLVTADATFIQKIDAIYNFVIHNITYDTQLADEIVAGLHPNYLPVIDNILDKRKGICFDFAALMAAMLRSQGIPTKLVVGNVNGDLRHAWLSVYSDVEGWVDSAIFFDGVNWHLMDPTFASSVRSSLALSEYIGDGEIYTELYLY